MLGFCMGLLPSVASIVRNVLIIGPDLDAFYEFFVPHNRKSRYSPSILMTSQTTYTKCMPGTLSTHSSPRASPLSQH